MKMSIVSWTIVYTALPLGPQMARTYEVFMTFPGLQFILANNNVMFKAVYV